MADADHTRLRALAEAATPGPWRTGAGNHWGRDVRAEDGSGPAWCGCANGLADASFIAAANPTTVLALLDEIEALRAVRDAAEVYLEAPARTVGMRLDLRAALDAMKEE